jgi:hypothetical protein
MARSKKIPIPNTVAELLAPGDVAGALELFRTKALASARGIILVSVNCDDGVSVFCGGVGLVEGMGMLGAAEIILMEQRNADDSEDCEAD